MALAMCVGIRMNTLTFFGFAFSVNQDDFGCILKLGGCQACKPSLFFAADSMALAMCVGIRRNTLIVFGLTFSVDENEF